MSGMVVVRPTPCGTCPYVTSTPPGIWAENEYRKLPAYDRDTPQQPPELFLCHCGTAPIVCAGWIACHGWNLLGLRVAALTGKIDLGKLPLKISNIYPSGAAACEAGLRGIRRPDQAARDRS